MASVSSLALVSPPEQDPLARARELLGAEADWLTDDEVRQLLAQAGAIARIIVQAFAAEAPK